MEPPIAKQRSSERLRQKEETGENSASTATAAGPPSLVRMNSAQKRMAKLRGAEQMLRGLTRFEPTVRWSACRAMRSELFAPYLAEEAAAPPPSATLRFTDYLHDEQED